MFWTIKLKKVLFFLAVLAILVGVIVYWVNHLPDPAPETVPGSTETEEFLLVQENGGGAEEQNRAAAESSAPPASVSEEKNFI